MLSVLVILRLSLVNAIKDAHIFFLSARAGSLEGCGGLEVDLLEHLVRVLFLAALELRHHFSHAHLMAALVAKAES